ncbi:hypothetical protein C8E95_6799 [Pseudonocardia autotrophica]|uniref:Uncharacterized protein n=1 Tax=Pseudonocardia autotrophica TaxID=2074 RepID=A0A1Y2N667_PSEAH|nr:hypothetical protein BG845_01217 [Pseudonocardia autotrophica]TDN77551.1 hypothetical protein C8E95_6799 [Pseudonocardia autotrophica]
MNIHVLCHESGVLVPLVDVLPCQRCWWMPPDCTCRHLEARSVVRAWRPDGQRASTGWAA